MDHFSVECYVLLDYVKYVMLLVFRVEIWFQAGQVDGYC